jgi:tetratricopeptide (TPR) repeat protein
VKRWLLALLLVLGPAWALGQAGKAIDIRSIAPPSGNSFEAHWSVYKAAVGKGDAEGANSALREIRRLRVERNIVSLESLAMARLAEGLEHLAAGRRDDAERAFRDGIALDPHLPDAYFALARIEFKKGLLGMLAGVKDTLKGTAARFTSVRGSHHLVTVTVPVVLLALFATAFITALALVLRHGNLLRHDLEEALGLHRRSLAFGIYVVLLLLPVLTFQGYGWLPLWWMALLFIYLGTIERLAAVAILLACVAVGPLVKDVESRVVTKQNPLFRAGLLALEGGPDSRAVLDLEEGLRRNTDDRDLSYLLAAQYKKAGRYDDASNVYRELLRSQPADAVALNNLANLEFAAGEFQAAIARYKQGIDSNPPAEQGATFQYNLSLAHLQRFEYQPAQEARSQADRLDASLIRGYDALWKYEKGDYAVVDLTLTPDEVWAKFSGLAQGVRVKNLAGKGAGGEGTKELVPAMLNRFAAFPLVFAAVILGVRRWRGPKMFTMRCVKCGTPFCRRCHLGAVAGGLCTQCHHLFVVRDGVSGPARNQKLLEVQKEDERRERVFRTLSLLTPGAGHVYAQKTLLGLLFVFLWSLILSAVLLAGTVLPVTEASGLLTTPWGLWVAGLLLLVIYVVANRARPDFEVMAVPIRRPSTGRSPATATGGKR